MNKLRKWSKDLVWFAWQQVLSCVFAIGIFSGLILTRYVHLGIPRYDLMLILCIVLQIIMVKSKLESLDELKVICVFHLVGLCLEIYKVHIGSWAYPDVGYAKLGGVPLYSGFMYAAIASYMCQAWRRFHLDIDKVPMVPTMIVAVLMYVNFYTDHRLPDVRWVLVAAALVLLRKTWVRFNVRGNIYRMHLSLSFVLIGFFVWVSENLGTFIGAWRYPSQQAGWKLVHGSKVGSWAILIIFSFMLILWLKTEKKTMHES